MNPDDFEQRLQRQPMRSAPADWKRDILRSAQAEARCEVPAESWRMVAWRELFWSCRRVWFGLAAVWGVILLLNVIPSGASSEMAKTVSQSRADLMEAFQEKQKQIMAELGTGASPDIEPPKPQVPQPRSERRAVAVCV